MLAEQYTNEDARAAGTATATRLQQGRGSDVLPGPWAFGEIAKSGPDLDLGTFPLPMTDDPASRKVRVNIDRRVDPRGLHAQGGRPHLPQLPLPAVMNEYNAAQLGYGTTTDSAP